MNELSSTLTNIDITAQAVVFYICYRMLREIFDLLHTRLLKDFVMTMYGRIFFQLSPYTKHQHIRVNAGHSTVLRYIKDVVEDGIEIIGKSEHGNTYDLVRFADIIPFIRTCELVPNVIDEHAIQDVVEAYCPKKSMYASETSVLSEKSGD